MLARSGEAGEAPSDTAAGMELVQLPWEPGRKAFKELKGGLQGDSATLPGHNGSNLCPLPTAIHSNHTEEPAWAPVEG